MTRRRQGRQLLAALITLVTAGAAAGGCGMGETEANAAATKTVPAIKLARDFLARAAVPLALLRAASAMVDTSFAGSGSYPFTVPHVAAEGSMLAIDTTPGKVTPETLRLVLPPETRLTLEEIAATLGRPSRLPALPGTPWLYAITVPAGRYTVALDGDPAKRARVVAITAIRDR